MDAWEQQVAVHCTRPYIESSKSGGEEDACLSP